MPNTKKKSSVFSSMIWVFLEALFIRGFSLLVKLFLARLLIPEAFGIIGMAAVFISLLEILAEMGMTKALVQLDKSKIQEKHWNTAFTISVVSSILALIVIFVTAALVAEFYNEPDLRLVFPVLGLSLVFNALSITQKARFQRNLQFKELSIIGITTTLLSSVVAIGMAFNGYGVWALVAKVLLESGLKTIGMWILYPVIYQLQFCKEAFQDIFSFGSYVTINNCLFFLTNNLDYLLVGKMLGSGALGIYTLAFTLTDTMRKQIMGSFNKVLFPVFSKMQNDKAVMAQYYLKAVKYNMLIIVPIMLLLILEAKELINILFGEKWLGAVMPVRLLSFAVIVHTVGGVSATLLNGAGFVRLTMNIEVIKMILVTAPAMVIGATLGGLNGASLAVLIHKSIGRIIYFWYIRKIFMISFRELAKAVLPVILPTVTMLVTNMMLISQFPPNKVIDIMRGFVELLVFVLVAILTVPEVKQVVKRSISN